MPPYEIKPIESVGAATPTKAPGKPSYSCTVTSSPRINGTHRSPRSHKPATASSVPTGRGWETAPSANICRMPQMQTTPLPCSTRWAWKNAWPSGTAPETPTRARCSSPVPAESKPPSSSTVCTIFPEKPPGWEPNATAPNGCSVLDSSIHTKSAKSAVQSGNFGVSGNRASTFGSLLLAQRKGERLQYVGKVDEIPQLLIHDGGMSVFGNHPLFSLWSAGRRRNLSFKILRSSRCLPAWGERPGNPRRYAPPRGNRLTWRGSS
jgi:hypothetical protein